jgi:hypothetical protein
LSMTAPLSSQHLISPLSIVSQSPLPTGDHVSHLNSQSDGTYTLDPQIFPFSYFLKAKNYRPF